MAGSASRILGCSSKYEADPREETKVLHHCCSPTTLVASTKQLLAVITVNQTLLAPSLFFVDQSWVLSF